MKGWLSHIVLCVVLLVLCASHAAQAQDAGMSDVEIIDGRGAAGGDKIIYAPGEDLRYVPEAQTVVKPTDSVLLQIQDFPMQQATMRPPESAAREEETQKPKDDSILTFNFLYYIIQKYKLQDIID